MPHDGAGPSEAQTAKCPPIKYDSCSGSPGPRCPSRWADSMRRPEGQRHPLLGASQTLIEHLLCAGNRGRRRGGQRRGTGKQESEPSATAAGRTRRLGAQGGVRRLRFSDVGLSSPTPPDPFCFLHAWRHERVSFPASSENTPSCAGCGKGHGKPSEGLPTGPIGSDARYLFVWFNFSVW